MLEGVLGLEFRVSALGCSVGLKFCCFTWLGDLGLEVCQLSLVWPPESGLGYCAESLRDVMSHRTLWQTG